MKRSFVCKGAASHFGTIAGDETGASIWSKPMYFRILDHGSPLAAKLASIAVSAVLVLTVVAPVLAVASRIVS